MPLGERELKRRITNIERRITNVEGRKNFDRSSSCLSISKFDILLFIIRYSHGGGWPALVFSNHYYSLVGPPGFCFKPHNYSPHSISTFNIRYSLFDIPPAAFRVNPCRGVVLLPRAAKALNYILLPREFMTNSHWPPTN